MIARADLTIAAAVSQKFLLPPTRNIRRAPTVPGRIFLVFRRFMTKVGKGQNLSLFYWLISFPDQHPVHDDVCSQGKVRDRKFMLSLDVRNKRILRPAEINLIALLQVGESDEDVVSGIELKDSLHLKASSVARSWASAKSKSADRWRSDDPTYGYLNSKTRSSATHYTFWCLANARMPDCHGFRLPLLMGGLARWSSTKCCRGKRLTNSAATGRCRR